MTCIALARVTSLQPPPNVRAATGEEQIILNPMPSVSEDTYYRKCGGNTVPPLPPLTFKRSPSIVSGFGDVPSWKSVVPLKTIMPCRLSTLMNRCPRSPSCPGLHPNRDVCGIPMDSLSISITLIITLQQEEIHPV